MSDAREASVAPGGRDGTSIASFDILGEFPAIDVMSEGAPEQGRRAKQKAAAVVDVGAIARTVALSCRCMDVLPVVNEVASASVNSSLIDVSGMRERVHGARRSVVRTSVGRSGRSARAGRSRYATEVRVWNTWSVQEWLGQVPVYLGRSVIQVCVVRTTMLTR